MPSVLAHGAWWCHHTTMPFFYGALMHNIIKIASSLIPDAILLSGVAAVSYGSYLIYHPAGYIAYGLFAVAGVVLMRRGAK